MLKQEKVLKRGEKLQSCFAAGLMMLVGTLAISKTGDPQHHSMEKVGAVSKDKWVSDVIGKLDRKYYTRADGQLMNDAELSAFLGEAYNTIATGGLNKLTDTGMRISGARANRGNASRQIHFKDADSYLQYQQLYGDRSLWEIMVGHRRYQ